jgi:2-keto-4-pentenoate hydratase/2-oxohepta-3-ene-1,7-dioic acid hydratase in catechol pathway
MKLVRFGAEGKEKPGLIDSSGKLRDLSGIIPDIEPRYLSKNALAKISKVKPESLPIVKGKKRFGVPINGVSKFVAIGLNYSDHAAEAGMAIPPEPIIFFKANSSLCGCNDDTIAPRNSKKLDWEIELGIVIGTKAQYVSKKDALKYVAGYCVMNDVSEREFQLERGGTWDKGKGCDTFGPVGPWLVTADEIKNPQKLDMWLDVNGESRQRGNTKTMIFDVSTIVSCVSQYMTLLPGDIIATGTPPGVGMGMKPKPRYLKVGDVVTCGIEGLGEQRQEIVASRAIKKSS